MKKLLLKFILSMAIKEGEKNNKLLESNASNVMNINKQLLFNILSDNKDTEYGKKYNFKDIKSIQEYKEKVPISTYDDYSDYIDRMVNNNETNLITVYPIVHYNLSSGTINKRKLIPYSKKAIDIYMKYGSFSNAIAKIYNKDNKNFLENPILFCMACSLSYLDNGISCGGLSERSLKQNEKIIEFASATPIEAIFTEKNIEIVYLQARFALMQQNISYVMPAFCSQFLQLMNYIEGNQKLLIRDIRQGTIDESINIPQNVRISLSKKIAPNAKRADELEKIFKEGFKGVASRIWPDMYSISAISGGGFSIYRKRLDYYIGNNIKINMYGYSASEGMFSMCLDFEEEAGYPVGDSCFFEFMPIGETDPLKTKTLDQIEIGKQYEIIITNLSGFYRYNMHDIIEVCDKRNGSFRIKFARRTSQRLNSMGEKVEESDLNKVIERFEKDTNRSIKDYIVHVDSHNAEVHYDFFIEFQDNNKFDENKYGDILQDELEKQCAVLKIFRERKLIGKCKIFELKKNSFHDYRVKKNMETSNQYKQLHIVDNESIVSYFKEEMKIQNNNDIISI